MEFPLSISGIWLLKYCILPPTKHKDTKSERGETLQRNRPSNKHTNTQIKNQIQPNDLELSNVDCVSANVTSSRSGAMLYIFEDDEAVIKMIIKGRSPTMRHVSRTHRVAPDWLFDRINLDRKIQIKFVDTKNQLADMLTKGNFTRDEWNHLLRLLRISNCSSASCPHTMSKRRQEGTGGERIMAKSRPTLILVSKTAASSSTAQSSSASNCPRILKAPSQSLSLPSMYLQLRIQIKMTQHRVLKCGQSDVKSNASAVRLAATKTNQNLDFLSGAGKLAAEGSSIVDSTLTQSGQTVSRYLLPMSHILRKSSQVHDRKLVANQWTTLTTSIRTR